MAGTKNLKRSRHYNDSEDGSDVEVAKTSKASKKSKTSETADSGKDADGNAFWSVRVLCHSLDSSRQADKSCQLTGTRRVGVSKFKGTYYVNIREFYTDQKDGELKPGKKVSLLVQTDAQNHQLTFSRASHFHLSNMMRS